jgi:hypothetical protein
VFQHKNLDYTEPIFSISVEATEDKGPLRYFLDIGTVPGASDIVSNKELGGPSTVIATVRLLFTFVDIIILKEKKELNIQNMFRYFKWQVVPGYMSSVFPFPSFLP